MCSLGRPRAARDLEACLGAVGRAMSLYDSAKRLPLLIAILKPVPPSIFWPALLENYSTCDDVWRHIDELKGVLRKKCRRSGCRPFLNGSALSFLIRYPTTSPYIAVSFGVESVELVGPPRSPSQRSLHTGPDLLILIPSWQWYLKETSMEYWWIAARVSCC
jgi:hypothetical protein